MTEGTATIEESPIPVPIFHFPVVTYLTKHQEVTAWVNDETQEDADAVFYGTSKFSQQAGGGFPKLGETCGGPYNKEHHILCSILGPLTSGNYHVFIIYKLSCLMLGDQRQVHLRRVGAVFRQP